METKHLECPLSVKMVGEDGSFIGYASVFDVADSQRDVVMRGAFARTLSQREGGQSVKLLWQHKMDEPIGVFTEIREDKRGLYVEGKLLLDVQRGREAYTLLKSGAIDGLSIGYTAVEYDFDNETGIRILSDVDLWEISLVTFPANAEAGVTAVKSELPETIREFERLLRDVGFSRAVAKSIAAEGFKYAEKQRDAEEGDEEWIKLDKALDKLINTLS